MIVQRINKSTSTKSRSRSKHVCFFRDEKQSAKLTVQHFFGRLALFSIMVAASCTLFAHPVDKETALAVGRNFMSSHAKDLNINNWHTTESPFENIFIITPDEGDGFVIVSGDDASKPIIGYSFDTKLSLDNELFVAWMRMYDQTIARMRQDQVKPTDEIANAWNRQGIIDERKEATVAPLLTTQWNQSPYYNDMCPFDETEQTRVVAGCGAIATAQVMKYWNYPERGLGSNSYVHNTYGTLSANFGNTDYQWDLMPDELTSTSSQDQIDAVAKLVYHVAVALNMQFSPYASSSYLYGYGDPDVPAMDNALVNYFKYSPCVMSHCKAAYDEAEWVAMMKDELDNGRPILYRGADYFSGGHLFVCDGYDASSLFHFNWGWGGHCDGFFELGNLNPSSYDYSHDCMMLTNIYPLSDTNAQPLITVTSNNDLWGSVSVDSPVEYGQRVTISATPEQGYKFVTWSDGNEYIQRSFPALSSCNYEARFAPIAGDTLFYCTQNMLDTRGYGPNNLCYWGIKVPASLIAQNQRLTGVQFYCRYATTYYLYVVNRYSSNTPLVNITFDVEENDRWISINLDESATIPTDEDLFIVLSSSRSIGYPAAYSPYCGDPNSCYIGSSRQTMSRFTFGSFMIKALFESESDPVQVENVSEPQYSVSTNAGHIVVSGAEGYRLQIFDVQGHCIASCGNASFVQKTAVPCSGVYFVKVGDDLPHKVVICK